MASRIKQDASNALNRLRDYLQYDRDGKSHLKAVGQYISKLRADRSAAIEEQELATARAEAATSNRIAAEREVMDLESQLTSRVAQVENMLRNMDRLSGELDTLRKSILDDCDCESDADEEGEGYDDVWTPRKLSSMIRLGKSLRRRMPSPPCPIKEPPDKPHFLSLNDFFESGRLNFDLIGMFITYSSLIGFTCSVVSPYRLDSLSRELPEAAQKELNRTLKWLGAVTSLMPKKWRNACMPCQDKEG